MKQIIRSGRTITLFGDSTTPRPLVWLHTFGDEGGAVWDACRSLHTPDFTLAAICIDDWNDALSPWAAPGLRRTDPDFAGNADACLQVLTDGILPEITAALPAPPLYHAIAGYSMAGLFAVYALYRTDRFRRAACASGSLWYPGFLEFACTHEMPGRPEAVYFSLGDRESHTRHPVMRTVQECTQALYAHFQLIGIPATFVQNPGNHFQEPALRTARGIDWMLGQAASPGIG